MKRILIIFLMIISLGVMLGCEKKEENLDINDDNNDVVIGDAKEVSLNPGTKDNFVFEMNGRRYQFTGNDKVYLYSYSQYMLNDSRYVDQNGLVSLTINVNGVPLNLVDSFDKSITLQTIGNLGTLVYENGDIKIYRIDDEYYIVWKEFFWKTSNADLLIMDGVSEQKIFESILEIPNVIKEVDDNNTLGDIDDEILKIDVMKGYRFALREEPKITYSAYFNVGSGNTTFDYNRIKVTSFVDYNSNSYVVEYEVGKSYFDKKDWIDTGAKFSNQIIYKYSDILRNVNYAVVLESTGEEILIYHSNNEDISLDETKKVLEIIFEKMM